MLRKMVLGLPTADWGLLYAWLGTSHLNVKPAPFDCVTSVCPVSLSASSKTHVHTAELVSFCAVSYFTGSFVQRTLFDVDQIAHSRRTHLESALDTNE